ncbi:MAG: winged helix-turn-helix transcriptional regulator [Actinobacteria bacterium]|nr:winged helix-turn-helix transcriptional regulator [Actinomycetota bacterium]
MAEWSFMTNHGRALLCIAHDPGMRLRDIAATLSITERSAYGIVNDLTKAGYVTKERAGRRNRYQVQGHLPLPDPLGRTRTVGEVLDLLVGDGDPAANGTEPPTRADGSSASTQLAAS